MVKRLFLYSLAGAVVVFLGMQFSRPEQNLSNDQTQHLSTLYPLPDSVQAILTVACYDCHSNLTRYPWYASFQPVAGMMDQHIRHGKKDLNFSEFVTYRPRKQYRRMEQIAEMVKENEMPIPSYLSMHKDAILTDGQKEVLYRWVEATRDSMRKVFPEDSLKMRKRP